MEWTLDSGHNLKSFILLYQLFANDRPACGCLNDY
jgi:hypothetical protein